MYKIKQTKLFSTWLTKLKDIKGKVSILRRVDRLKNGNFGDYKYISENIYELRISSGPGYRVYYIKDADKIVILLIGGDKSSQNIDIKKAKILAKEYKDEK
jgi:putative addiction module killer protein